jgi:hypothetical protein
MRLFALVLGPCLAALGVAADYKTPEAMLAALYAPYLPGGQGTDENFYPTGLQKLFAIDAEGADGVGAVDFDPIVASQDSDISKLAFGPPYFDGDKAVVVVTFDNFTTPISLTYTLINEAHGWRVDDIENRAGEFPWVISKLLIDAQG